MIIDAHMHLMEHLAPFCAKGEGRPIGNGMVRFATGEEFRFIPEGMGEKGFTAESCIELMDKNGIDKSVLLQSGYYGFQNDYYYEVSKKYPDRLFSVGVLDPYCQEKMRILDHLTKDFKMTALKFEMSQGCGLVSYHPDFKIDGPEIEEVFEKADSLNMTVAFDIGGPGQTSYQIAGWERVIKRYKNIRFVVCHILVPKRLDQPNWAEEIGMLAKDNVWFDFAAIPYNNPGSYPYETAIKLVERAAAITGSDRLLWGSDAPFVLSYETYSDLLNYIKESKVLAAGDIEKMLGANAIDAYNI